MAHAGFPRSEVVTLRHPLARMLAASLVMFLALALSFAVTETVLSKHTRIAWPNLAAALEACRAWGVDSEKRPQRGQFLPDLQPHSRPPSPTGS